MGAHAGGAGLTLGLRRTSIRHCTVVQVGVVQDVTSELHSLGDIRSPLQRNKVNGDAHLRYLMSIQVGAHVLDLQLDVDTDRFCASPPVWLRRSCGGPQ
jgi:hypothetical protein